jgi:methylmalonyl-CoA mutase C-terminal domain/subunit
MERRIRILICKPGLDGHDRGAKVVASTLRDAGFEVIYTGLRQTPEMVVRDAIQEDVDAIGLSVHSGAHLTIFRRVMDLLGKENAGHVLVTGGGIIPDQDIGKLAELGVGRLFRPGTKSEDYIGYLKEEVARRRASSGPGFSWGSPSASSSGS